jgi:hypothetical protein
MTRLPRRTVQELVFLHKVEPKIKDVFVEGESDRAMVIWFSSNTKCHGTEVKTISAVEIDDGEILSDGRKANNRERTIQLAIHIEKTLSLRGKILCIVDKDYDDQLGCKVEARDVLYTDFTCLEMYAWDESVLDKYLWIYCNKGGAKGRDLMSALKGALTSIFALRLAAEALKFTPGWFDRAVCVELKGNGIEIDRREYARRLLNKISGTPQLEGFLQEAERFEATFNKDERYQIHGHDFLMLLSYYLRKIGVENQYANKEVIARSLPLCHEWMRLRDHHLFAQISEFCSGRVVAGTE